MKKSSYLYVLNIFLASRYLHLLLTLAVTSLLTACATGNNGLNSDRIQQTFGSYGVEVLYSDSGRRISNLYSLEDGEKIMRTYAVVDFSGPPRGEYAREHARIESGDSIGATFRDGGWSISKQHLFIGELEIPATYTDIGDLMHITLPAELATHVYVLNVSREGHGFNYATITEIHHPDYLDAAGLREIYGEIIFDDSKRDSIHDFIGPPNPRK